MKQFSLEKYLENKQRKVVTRDGREVEIVKYDMKGTHFPVLYVISNEDGSQEPCECSKSGMCQFDNTQSSTDLFFADEEEELTEFESKLAALLVYNHPMDIESAESIAKRESKQLLDLARKEILKSLPKWIPNKFEKRNWETCKAYINTPRYLVPRCYLVHDDWMISVEDLETLPKEG